MISNRMSAFPGDGASSFDEYSSNFKFKSDFNRAGGKKGGPEGASIIADRVSS
jgi:hypothetical protein